MGTANQFPPVEGVEFLRSGSPSGTFSEPFPRWAINTDAGGSSGRMSVMAVPLHPGDLVSTISCWVGGTAAATVTHAWAALYGPSGALMAQSADNPSQVLAANSQSDFHLATAQLIITPGLYQVGIMVAATTVNSFAGHQMALPSAAGAIAGTPPLGANYGSSYTTTAPATLSAPAAIGSLYYFVAH